MSYTLTASITGGSAPNTDSIIELGVSDLLGTLSSLTINGSTGTNGKNSTLYASAVAAANTGNISCNSASGFLGFIASDGLNAALWTSGSWTQEWATSISYDEVGTFNSTISTTVNKGWNNGGINAECLTAGFCLATNGLGTNNLWTSTYAWNNALTSTTVSVTPGSTPGTGNTVLAIVSYRLGGSSDATSRTLTDNAGSGNTWTEIYHVFGVTNNGIGVGISFFGVLSFSPNIVNASATLTGVNATFGTNAPTGSGTASTALTGVNATFAANSPLGSGNATRALTGVNATFAAGTITAYGTTHINIGSTPFGLGFGGGA